MAKKIQLRIVTPTRKMYEGDIDMVIMKTVEGEIAFLSGHIPLTTTLDYGIMKIVNDGETKEAVVLGGFAEVIDDVVTVLSDIAQWPGEIDINRAQEAKERAERRFKDSAHTIDIRRAQLAFRRATVRLEVSSYPIIKGRVTHN